MREKKLWLIITSHLKGAYLYTLFNAYTAGTLRAHKPFVPGKAQHVYAHFFHIDGPAARRLRSIHYH